MSAEKLRIYGARLLVFIVWMAAWEYIPMVLRPTGIVLFIMTGSVILLFRTVAQALHAQATRESGR